MVKYRPHKGSLGEAMEQTTEFSSVEEMFIEIVKEWADWSGKTVFEIGDLSLGENLRKDERIDWKETRHVCTKRIGEEIYPTPQCIGICSIEDK